MSKTTLHTRRQFLRTGILGGAMAWTVPAFLERTFLALDAAAADSPIQVATGKDSPILVVLQLAGGNDGLNTLIPIEDDAYFRARPSLAIPGKETLRVADGLGLHGSLTGLKSLYDEGDLALIQGVGYPNPNRSHFRSTEIWQTATDSNRVERHGWIGRYFDSCCAGEDPAVGVSIGKQAPQAFAAANPHGISLSKPEQFRFASENSGDPVGTEAAFRDMTEMESENTGGSIGDLPGMVNTEGSAMDFLRKTTLDAQVSSDKILQISKKFRPMVKYPGGQLSESLSLVSRLIAGGMPTRIYYVSQGGYDTHSGQLASHARLLKDLDGSLSAFAQDLKAQGNYERVVVMTFSEFGRRVAENASKGTDHGAAAPMFVFGGGVKAGIYGRQPSLTELNEGDLIHNVDFRSVYATMLDKWLHAPSEVVLKRKFQNLAFI